MKKYKACGCSYDGFLREVFWFWPVGWSEMRRIGGLKDKRGAGFGIGR